TYRDTMYCLPMTGLDLRCIFTAKRLHISSYYLHKRSRPAMVYPFRKAKEAGFTTPLDTNDDPNNRWTADIQLVFKYVDILLPNENEACQLAGAADFRQAAEILSKNVPLVVIKRGSQGAYARRGAGEFEDFR